MLQIGTEGHQPPAAQPLKRHSQDLALAQLLMDPHISKRQLLYLYWIGNRSPKKVTAWLLSTELGAETAVLEFSM